MRRKHIPELLVSFLLVQLNVNGEDSCEGPQEYELEFEIDVDVNDTELVYKLTSPANTENNDAVDEFEKYMEELSDSYFEAAKLNTTVDSEATVSHWNFSQIPNNSSSGKIPLRGKIFYKMLFKTENNVSSESLQNYYTSLFDHIGFDNKTEVARNIKEWLDLTNSSAEISVTDVEKIPSPGPTCPPVGPTFPSKLNETVYSRGAYELEFISCFLEESPGNVFNDTGPICFSMNRLSTDMSRSVFNHVYTDLVQKECNTLNLRFPKLSSSSEPRQLIPAEFEEDIDSEESSEKDEDAPPGNLRGSTWYRELENDTNNTLIFNTSLTCYKVRFEIDMEWLSDYYPDVVRYSAEFLTYVSTPENLEGLATYLSGEYGLEDQNLRDISFTAEPTNKPTMSPAPTLAPTMKPTNETIPIPQKLNASSLAPSFVPALKPADGGEFDGAVIGVIVVGFVGLLIAGVLIWLHVKRLQTKLDNAIGADPNGPQSAIILQNKSSALQSNEPFDKNETSEAGSATPPPPPAAAAAGSVQRSTTADTSTDLIPTGPINDPSTAPGPGPTMADPAPPTAHHSSGILSNRTSVDSWANSASTADTISQDDFVMPVMTVNDLSGGNLDEAAAAEKYKQGFLSFLPSVDEDPRRLTTLSSDEFDQFKDQKLEKMRNSIEGNVAGVNGMMSLAMTKALMESGTSEARTSIPTDMTGAEIEANSLWEVSEWVRQNEGASDYKRREYMQKLLNKMVLCVRAGVVDPEDGSRSIHSCAALLGLQLAQEPPQTVLILTGMLKTTTDDDVQEAFAQFGPIEGAAVATGEKGFGVIRFRSPKSAVRAMEVFRTSEVVLNNVAIQLTPLS